MMQNSTVFEHVDRVRDCDLSSFQLAFYFVSVRRGLYLEEIPPSKKYVYCDRKISGTYLAFCASFVVFGISL